MCLANSALHQEKTAMADFLFAIIQEESIIKTKGYQHGRSRIRPFCTHLAKLEPIMCKTQSASNECNGGPDH
jgi:hypothetical protein